jgi:hypothetical protein
MTLNTIVTGHEFRMNWYSESSMREGSTSHLNALAGFRSNTTGTPKPSAFAATSKAEANKRCKYKGPVATVGPRGPGWPLAHCAHH